MNLLMVFINKGDDFVMPYYGDFKVGEKVVPDFSKTLPYMTTEGHKYLTKNGYLVIKKIITEPINDRHPILLGYPDEFCESVESASWVNCNHIMRVEQSEDEKFLKGLY